MKKFLKDLERELSKLNVNPKEIKEILEDHKEMMEAAKQEGLNEDQMSNKFGDPVKVASEIHSDLKSAKAGINLNNVKSIAKFDTDKFSLVKAFHNVEKVLEFNIELISEDFILSDYEGEDIQVYQKDIEKIDDYEINFDKEVFTLKRTSSKKVGKIFSFNKKSGEFLVLIPKGTNCKLFNYHTVSGDIVINDLSAISFKLKGTSGDVDLSNMNLGEAKFNFVNGDIEIQGFKALSLDISLVNGDVELQQGVVEKEISIHSVSGDIEINEVECAEASFKTVSGDVEGNNFYVKEISLKSVSGDVEIKNEDKSREIIVKSKKTLSGDVKINK